MDFSHKTRTQNVHKNGRHYVKIFLIGLMAFFVSTSYALTKASNLPVSSNILNSSVNYYVEIDTCVVIEDATFKQHSADSFEPVMHCVDYDDMVDVAVGQADRIYAYRLPYRYVNRTRWHELKNNLPVEFRKNSVLSLKLKYGFTPDIDKLKNKIASGESDGVNFYGDPRYLTTLDKLITGDF